MLIESYILKYEIALYEGKLILNKELSLHIFKKIGSNKSNENIYDFSQSKLFVIASGIVKQKLDLLKNAMLWNTDNDVNLIEKAKISDVEYLGLNAERWYLKYRHLNFTTDSEVFREEEKIFFSISDIDEYADSSFQEKFPIFSKEVSDHNNILGSRSVKFPSGVMIEDLKITSIEKKQVNFADYIKIIRT